MITPEGYPVAALLFADPVAVSRFARVCVPIRLVCFPIRVTRFPIRRGCFPIRVSRVFPDPPEFCFPIQGSVFRIDQFS